MLWGMTPEISPPMDVLEVPGAALPGPTADRVEALLRWMVERLVPDRREAARRGRGRARVLPALCLWGGLMVCVLRGFASQRALWRLLTQTGLWDYPRFPLSDEAVYDRLERAGAAPMARLFADCTELLRARVAPFALGDLAPFATEVVALDTTTLDKVARLLPALRGLPPGDRHLLPGKLAGLFDLRRQQWRRVEHIEDACQNDKVSARELVYGLPFWSLILFDLGYFAFEWFDDLTDRGYYWVSRQRARTSYEVAHVSYEDGEAFDGLVWLGKHRADRAAHAVRLVRFRAGDTTYEYLTNVTDPATLSMRDIARLYARRWDFELAAKTVKRHLGLHLIWSAKPAVVQQQVWAVLILAQIFQALQMEIAGRAGVDPFEVSLALLIEYAPQLAREGRDPVAFFVERGREAGFIRPSRRTRIRAPDIPTAAIRPPPAGLLLTRTPRYAHRRCDRRHEKPDASANPEPH
jgi:DDE family transposase